MEFFQRRLLKVNKGFSLIEMLLSTALIGIILSMIIPMFFKVYRLYNRTIINNRSYLCAQEALMFIENEINQSSINNDFTDNMVIKLDVGRKKIYKETSGDNRVSIVLKENSDAPRKILDNISDFQVARKNNVIYLCITTMDGKKFERCLALKPYL